MRRGDLVTIALQGDFGKPRPALIVQSDHFDAHPTVTVLLISSALVAAPLLRVTVEPDELNGLRARSQIMVDKAMTVMRGRSDPRSADSAATGCWKSSAASRCFWGSRDDGFRGSRIEGSPVTLIVNGEPREIAAASLAEALQALDYGEAKVATALNGEFVPARARERDAGEGRRPDRDPRAEAGGVSARERRHCRAATIRV